jgi:hypothetical protein
MSDRSPREDTEAQSDPSLSSVTVPCAVPIGDGHDACGKVAAGLVELETWGVGPDGMARATMHACAEHLGEAHASGLWHAWFRRAPGAPAAAYSGQQQDHPELDPFNEGFARRAAVSMFKQAQRIEAAKKPRSGLLIPDGIKAPPLDFNQELIRFMHDADMAIVAILDLILEARTGEPCLKPDPDAPHNKPVA